MANRELSDEDLANLSDDEVMNMAFAPERIASPDDVVEEPGEAEPEVDDASGDADAAVDEAPADAELGDDAESPDTAEPETETAENILGKSDEDSEKVPAKPVTKPALAKATDPAEAAKATKAASPEGIAAGAEPATQAAAGEIDYKVAYEKIMAPFKANGKEIKLQNADEATRLMQMGANYTKKLQGLAPQLKILRMLENNGLLDEKKLAFLIDIDKKNPAAIKKAIKDSGLDPMDVDISEDPGYKPGNYQVSDQEMSFTSAVQEVASEPGGKELISTIQKSWDTRSKDALWEDPGILRILTDQRNNGIYAKITTEVERRKTLGYVPSNAPFLETYHKVGQELQQQGLLTIPPAAAPIAVPAATVSIPAASQVTPDGRKVVDQRTGLRKPAVASVVNNDKARAASPTKAVAPKPGTSSFNPLAMSDEDFEKNTDMARRV